MFEIRGIIIHKKENDKFVRIVAKKDHHDRYVSIERKANVPITRELIMQHLTGHYGIPEGQITWPHHIEVKDI
uniref:Uncharacterized protein n=1 Tax=viral metagenome TaxID=1070528 RepID=A0A6M3Y3H2_9ZZZZ